MMGFGNLLSQDIISHDCNAVNQILINQSHIQSYKITFQEGPIGCKRGLQNPSYRCPQQVHSRHLLKLINL